MAVLMGYFITLSLLLLTGWLYFYISTREQSLRKKWELVSEGEYIKVVHKNTNLAVESGIRRKKTVISSLVFSTIFFKDGRTAIVMNVSEFPPSGAYIKIYKNPLPEFKIETVAIPPSGCI